MSNVLSIVGKGKGDSLLLKVDKAPEHLSVEAKKEFKRMGTLLAQAQRLKAYHLGTLEIWADAYAQWQCAVAEIKRLNAIKPMSGFVQRFPGGTSNITGEMTVKKDAVATMLHCCKLFGLDPKSDKDLKATDPNQGNLFDDLRKALNS
jgi:P27 family predicted phage terminase small subunit